jgi:hypothetical protein
MNACRGAELQASVKHRVENKAKAGMGGTLLELYAPLPLGLLPRQHVCATCCKRVQA